MAYGNAIRRNFVGMERPCSRCEATIIITEKMAASGTYTCAPCRSKSACESAARNKERKRKNNRAYASRNSANRAEKTAAYRARHPHKRAAHQAVQTALRNGTLERQNCTVCGAVNAHAHHDDYDKPLAVVWLCHQHHMERHAMLAERSK